VPAQAPERDDRPHRNLSAQRQHGRDPEINRINENISHFADGKTIRYLNINDKLADKNGKLFDGMMTPDNLHPTVRGYQVWADALKPIFLELLGPPAATDQAPPPTGDPSARRP
jgi:lysophospholipase L1-like esterase